MANLSSLFQGKEVPSRQTGFVATEPEATSQANLYDADDLVTAGELVSMDTFIDSSLQLKKRIGLEFLDAMAAVLMHKMVVYMETALRFHRRMWMRFMYELKKTRDFIGQEAKMYSFFKGKQITLYASPNKDGVFPIPEVDRFMQITITMLKRIVTLSLEEPHHSEDAIYEDKIHAEIQKIMDAYYNEIPYTQDELESVMLGEITLYEIDTIKSWRKEPALEQKAFEEFFPSEMVFRRFKKTVSSYYATAIMMAKEMDKLAVVLNQMEKRVRSKVSPIGQSTESMATLRRFFSIFVSSVPQKLIQKHPTFWNSYQIGSAYDKALKNKEVI